MHPQTLRDRARRLHADGLSLTSVARTLNLPYSTVHYWCRIRPDTRAVPVSSDRCFRCRTPPGRPDHAADYLYLLGLYLGDGHLVTSDRVPVLRIYCTDTWPDLIDACEAATRAVLAGRVQRVRKKGCVAVQSYAKHWPCLLPQHGPGKKHERPIVLAGWQRELVAARPGPFVRGLFHSDGCRVANRVTKGEKAYRYPRYLFTNESRDIMGLCQWGLDLLGVEWRMNRPNSLSVAKRDAVATLDCHVGPKS